MTPRLLPVDSVVPDALHRALLRAHTHSGNVDRSFTAQRIADRVRVSAVTMGIALDALAADGLLRSRRTGDGLTIYYRGDLPDRAGVDQRRPTLAPISRRELWSAISSAWLGCEEAATEDIAARLDAPVGPADRAWLRLRLATWTAAELLVLSSTRRWALTTRGLDQYERLRRVPPSDPQVWAAIAAEQPRRRRRGGLDWDAVGRRLGLPLSRLTAWADQAVDDGLIVRTDGGFLLSAGGWQRVDDVVKVG